MISKTPFEVSFLSKTKSIPFPSNYKELENTLINEFNPKSIDRVFYKDVNLNLIDISNDKDIKYLSMYLFKYNLNKISVFFVEKPEDEEFINYSDFNIMKENEKHLIKYNLSMSEGSQNIDLELTNESIISNFLKKWISPTVQRLRRHHKTINGLNYDVSLYYDSFIDLSLMDGTIPIRSKYLRILFQSIDLSLPRKFYNLIFHSLKNFEALLVIDKYFLDNY